MSMLDKVLEAYTRYYTINRDTPAFPFAAEAVFHSHGEQYFLVKAAKISEADSNEYVFFALEEQVDAVTVQRLDEAAWTQGLSRVTPHSGHRNSDITLVIIAERFSEDASSSIKKLHHYKSYRYGFQGWSNYRIIALESSTGQLTYNRQGQSLKKLFQSIIKK